MTRARQVSHRNFDVTSLCEIVYAFPVGKRDGHWLLHLIIFGTTCIHTFFLKKLKCTQNSNSYLCPIFNAVMVVCFLVNFHLKSETSDIIMQSLGVPKGSNHHLFLSTASCRQGTGIVDPINYLVASLPSFDGF